jgi:hypothetical protein
MGSFGINFTIMAKNIIIQIQSTSTYFSRHYFRDCKTIISLSKTGRKCVTDFDSLRKYAYGRFHG